jgi:trehalose synthase
MNQNTLEKYKEVVGEEIIEEIVREAKPLKGKYVTHVNATYYGGGVAEILDSLVVLMNLVGINAGWRALKGTDHFFNITKLFHNGSQGGEAHLTPEIKKIYEGINERNSIFMHLEKSDAIIAHDPQVLPLINYYKKTQPWIWRCHIDISHPNPEIWNYLKEFIAKYDKMIVSDEKYIKNNIPVSQNIIMPSIDPLTAKNKKLSSEEAKGILKKTGIDTDKPIVSQISRFDYWKDPIGVIEAFEIAKKKVDAHLVLLGNYATDDPEGVTVYEEVVKRAQQSKDITILVNVENNDLVVNALQTISQVVLQKSLREGFALTVSEALWKETPVIGGNTGGIPNQIIHGKNGYLVENIQETADRIVELLKDDEKRKKMGAYGKEFVRKNFLITRHLLDYIKLLKEQMKL